MSLRRAQIAWGSAWHSSAPLMFQLSHVRRGSQSRTRRYDAVAIRHSVGGKVAVTANHVGVLRSGHNADTDSAVAIADNLLKHHDISLLRTLNPAFALYSQEKSARGSDSISVGSSSAVPFFFD